MDVRKFKRPAARRGSLKEFFGTGAASALFPLSGSARDFSGNALSITVNGTPGVSRSRVGGPAYRFLASNNYLWFNTYTMANSVEFTISAWIYPETTAEATPMIYSEAVNGTTNNYLKFYVNKNTNALAVNITDSASTQATVETEAGTLQMDRWHHVMLVQVSKSERHLYIDGVHQATNTILIASLSTTAGRSCIALAYQTAATNQFTGRIEEFGIYKRAFSQEEIWEYYKWSTEPLTWKSHIGPASGFLGGGFLNFMTVSDRIDPLGSGGRKCTESMDARDFLYRYKNRPVTQFRRMSTSPLQLDRRDHRAFIGQSRLAAYLPMQTLAGSTVHNLGGGATYTSGGGEVVTKVGNVVQDTGKFGGGLKFGGTTSDYLTKASAQATSLFATGTAEFTFSIWFKLDATVTGSPFIYLENFYNPAFSAGGVYVDLPNMRLVAFNNNGVNYLSFSIYSPIGSVQFGRWHHVVFTRRNTNWIDLYLDGKLVDHTNSTADAYSSYNYTLLGIYLSYSGGWSNPFKGSMQQAVMLRRGMLAQEVFEYYKWACIPKADPPRLFCNFYADNYHRNSPWYKPIAIRVRKSAVHRLYPREDLSHFFKFKPLTLHRLNGVGSDYYGNVYAKDESGNGVHGTVAGTVGQTPITGVNRPACLFGGTSADYLSFPDAVNLPNVEEKSIMGWAKYDDTSVETYQTILSETRNGNTAPFQSISISTATGALRWSFRDDLMTTFTLTSTITAKPNVWFHFACVQYSKSRRIIFINGVPSDADTTAIGTFTCDQAAIGAFRDGSGDITLPFKGGLQDIARFARSFVFNEISDFYKSATEIVTDRLALTIPWKTYRPRGIFRNLGSTRPAVDRGSLKEFFGPRGLTACIEPLGSTPVDTSDSGHSGTISGAVDKGKGR